MENKPPTTEEAEAIDKFIKYGQERITKLVLMNQMTSVGLDENTPEEKVKQAYILALQYASQKWKDIFEDYKKGVSPNVRPLNIKNLK